MNEDSILGLSILPGILKVSQDTQGVMPWRAWQQLSLRTPAAPAPATPLAIDTHPEVSLALALLARD